MLESFLKEIIFIFHQMPPQAVSHALEFIYTGRLNKRAGLHLASLEQVFSLFFSQPFFPIFCCFFLIFFSRLFLHLASLEQVFLISFLYLCISQVLIIPNFPGGQTVGAADPCRVPEQPEEQGGVPQR